MRRIRIRPPASRLGFVAGVSATLYGLAVELSMLMVPPPNSEYRIIQIGDTFALVFLLVFVSALGARVLRAGRGSYPLAIAAGVGGVAAAVMSLTTNPVTEILMSLPLSLVVAVTSWVLLQASGPWLWVGLAGFIVAGLLVVRSLAFIGVPALPFPPLYPVWFEVVGVSLLKQSVGATCAY